MSELVRDWLRVVFFANKFALVNQEKSQVARSDRVKFLSMTIVGKTIAISHKALQTAMAKVKELTPALSRW